MSQQLVDPELLEILACPVTRQSLSIAGEDVLAKVNARIAAGGCKDAGGADVTDPLEAGLVREDGQLVYPIRDRIPVLLPDSGIPVE